jgi:hypothetical protein
MYFRKTLSSDVIVTMTGAEADSGSGVVSMSMTTHDVSLRYHHHYSLVVVSQRAPVAAVGDCCCRVDVAAIESAAASIETGKDCMLLI